MPAMTREERNKKRSSDRYAEYFQKKQSAIESLVSIFTWAPLQGWSHDKLCSEKRRIMPQGVPLWVTYAVDGAFDALMANAYRHQLVFCYAHPETGVITDSNSLCDDGLASKLDSSTGAHYWRTEKDGVVSYVHNFSNGGA